MFKNSSFWLVGSKKLIRHNFLLIFFSIYFLLLSFNVNAIYLFIGDERQYASSVAAFLEGNITSNNHPLLGKSIWTFMVFVTSVFLGTTSAFFWRVGTILFSIATLAVFYKISRLLFSKTPSVLATVILSADPMFFAFSRIMHLDIIALFYTLVALFYLLKFLKDSRTFNYYVAGFFLGLSLAVKFTALTALPVFLTISFFLLRKTKKKTGFVKANLIFGGMILGAYTLGNALFFFLNTYGVNFLNFTYDLFFSQLSMAQNAENYLYSPAWSWFTIPQILTLFRTDYISRVQSVVAFQNPVFFSTTILIIISSVFLLVKNKIKQKNEALTVLSFFLALYLPWFFGVHTTYYYYIIPLIPLVILLFMFILKNSEYFVFCLKALTFISIIIFALYYPLLVGKVVSKDYEKTLFSYSRYGFPPKDSLFCQHCSPRK